MEEMYSVRFWGQGGGHGASKPSLGVSRPLQNLDVLTNLEALQTPLFRAFMEVPLHRHD